MDDASEPTPATDQPTKRQRGPRRRTAFVLGGLLGLVLGIIGAVTVPDLLPESGPDCERPEQVVWSQTDTGGVRLEVDYAPDTSDGCDANIVFSERPQP